MIFNLVNSLEGNFLLSSILTFLAFYKILYSDSF